MIWCQEIGMKPTTGESNKNVVLEAIQASMKAFQTSMKAVQVDLKQERCTLSKRIKKDPKDNQILLK